MTFSTPLDEKAEVAHRAALDAARDTFERQHAQFTWVRGSVFDAFVEERLRCTLEGPQTCRAQDAAWCLLAGSNLPVEEAFLLHGAGVLSRHRWEIVDQSVWTLRLEPLSTLRSRASELHLWLSVRRLLDVVASGDPEGLARGLVLQGAGANGCGSFAAWADLLQRWAIERTDLGVTGSWPVWRSGRWS